MATRKTTAASDLLGKLNQKSKSSAKKSQQTSARSELALTEELQEFLRRWVSAKSLEEVVVARKENSKDEIEEFMMDFLSGYLWQNKSRPQNPKLEARNEKNEKDVEALYIFQNKFKVTIPFEDDVDPVETAVAAFVSAAGLEEEDAQRLVEEELDMNPQTQFRSFSELVEGHYGEGRQWVDATPLEQEAGRKLLAFLLAETDEDNYATVEALTDEERDVAIRKVNKVVVRAGFFDRVATYCHSKEQVRGVLRLLSPVNYPARAKFGISDDPTRKAERLVEAAADILGADVAHAES